MFIFPILLNLFYVSEAVYFTRTEGKFSSLKKS